MLASSRSQGLSLTVLVHYRCLKVIRPGARFPFDGVPSHHNPQGDGGPLASLPASRTGLSPSCRRRVPARPSVPKGRKAGGDRSDSRRSRRGLAAPPGGAARHEGPPPGLGPPSRGASRRGRGAGPPGPPAGGGSGGGARPRRGRDWWPIPGRPEAPPPGGTGPGPARGGLPERRGWEGSCAHGFTRRRPPREGPRGRSLNA